MTEAEQLTIDRYHNQSSLTFRRASSFRSDRWPLLQHLDRLQTPKTERLISQTLPRYIELIIKLIYCDYSVLSEAYLVLLIKQPSITNQKSKSVLDDDVVHFTVTLEEPFDVPLSDSWREPAQIYPVSHNKFLLSEK